MKILFVIPSLAKGGQEKAGMLLCNYLMQYHEVTALCFSSPEENEYQYKCPVIRVVTPARPGLPGKLSSAFRRIREIRKIKKQLKPDVSIAFGNTAIILNDLSACGEKKIASVRQSFHILLKDAALPMKAHLKLYVRALRRADRIVCVSDAINRELKDHFGIDNHLFINNAVDTTAIGKLISEPAPLPANRKWISHSGRFDQSKGHWHLVKIFAAIKKKIPDAGLVLLGTADESSAAGPAIAAFCKDYLTQQNISWTDNPAGDADVIFAGHQVNPFRFIAASRLFVLPSLWEGFPNALVEAMACGMPVAAADCKTGPAEILVGDGETYGLLLSAFTDRFNRQQELNELEKQWALQITELMLNEERLKYFSDQSIKRAAHYTIENMGSQWLYLVNSMQSI
jgi:glycosyltransferase involved in cell wall biosynthesis